MKGAGYLTIEDIVPKDFLRRPKSVIVEAGNGQGKTYSSTEYAVRLQKMGIFDRIYILEYSQKGCENVVRKIEKLGGWAVHHIGLEKFCPFFSKIKKYVQEGIPATFFCYSCKFFENKSRIAYLKVVDELQNIKKGAVRPLITAQGYFSQEKVCTHPIIRSFILDPNNEIDRRIQLRETPIIVVPGQLFLNHKIIGRWHRFLSRQRRPRRSLLIIDEGDALFYSSLRTEIPDVHPTKEDIEILKQFSPKTKKLEFLVQYYENLLAVLKKIVENRGRAEQDDVKKIEKILISVAPLLSSFDRRKKSILHHVIKNKIKTRVFLMASVLEELYHIENMRLVLRTLEKSPRGFIMYDYDYGVRLFFDPSYPWKHFWKIVLSATFPTEKIVESNFVSEKSKRILLRLAKSSKDYENVFVSSYRIFDDVEGVLNRNEEIRFSVPKILELIKKSVKKYEETFGTQPRGVCIWFGNSKQLGVVVSILKRFKLQVKTRRRFSILKFRGIPIFLGYVGSSVSRGLDFDSYDISIVVGPLLRPPRNSGVLDVIDFARGVSEAVQAGMRIVRSPSPSRPKLVILEKHMTTSFYSYFYPSWFKDLFRTSKISLD